MCHAVTLFVTLSFGEQYDELALIVYESETGGSNTKQTGFIVQIMPLC